MMGGINRILQIIEDFELINAASVSDDAQNNKYFNCIPQYLDAMLTVRQQHEYSDVDIKRYQSHVDCWFQVWNKLHLDAECTNYTHMLSSGHLVEYMF